MPDIPSHPTNRAQPQERLDRRAGATQRTPEPGTSGRMNERDNQRILRIALVAVTLVFVGVLTLNAFWLPGTGSTMEPPVSTEAAPNTVPGTNSPAGIGMDPAPR